MPTWFELLENKTILLNPNFSDSDKELLMKSDSYKTFIDVTNKLPF